MEGYYEVEVIQVGAEDDRLTFNFSSVDAARDCIVRELKKRDGKRRYSAKSLRAAILQERVKNGITAALWWGTAVTLLPSSRTNLFIRFVEGEMPHGKE